METGMAGFAVGILVAGFLPFLPSPPILLMALLVLMTSGLILYRACQGVIPLRAICLFSFLAGLFWHGWYGARQLELRLPFELEGQDILVSGTVISIPSAKGPVQRFRFRIDSSPEPLAGRKILLNYYGDQAIVAAQQWQFVVRLNRPHGFANPASFDYEAWLMQQGISARGYVRSSGSNRLLGRQSNSLAGLRSMLRDRIIERTGGLVHQAEILALALGDRSLLSNSQWQLFNRTGTSHLMVVSGLHIGLLAGLCFALVNTLWRRSSRLMLWFPAQRAGYMAALTGALVYGLLAGLSLPTLRALVMVGTVMCARLMALKQGPRFTFLLALSIVLIFDPLAATGAGFWLSFVAVGALLLVFAASPRRAPVGDRLPVWSGWIKAQWVVFVALLVPLAFFMGAIPALAPLVNTVAIPLVSWLIVPLTLTGTALLMVAPEVSSLIFLLADMFLAAMMTTMTSLSQQAWIPLTWHLMLVAPLVIATTSLACLLVLLPLPCSYRWLGLPLLLPLVIPAPQTTQANLLTVHVLDVGQGLAAIIQTRNHTLVYDTGPASAGGFDSGAQIIAPVLNWLGVRYVDELLVSHGDNDHAGGVAGLLSAKPVNNIRSGETLTGINRIQTPCQAGQQWQWDAVNFRILHPVDGEGYSANNRSCVLQVQTDHFSLLLPGDIEARVEYELLAKWPGQMATDVLVAAHHGSKTSSSAVFVRTAAPKLVIFSSGYRNQFSHPAETVSKRFAAIGATLMETRQTGMITLSLKKGDTTPSVETYRLSRQRYWN